jgi:hypothetical protein
MLVVCRLAGLSALILDYASRLAVAQPSATVAAETATVSARASCVRPVGWRFRLQTLQRRSLAGFSAPDENTAGRQKRLQRPSVSADPWKLDRFPGMPVS